jgi:hypothetical protein
LFGFRENNDTSSFVDTITFFQQTGDIIDPNRYLNPFYGIVGAYLFPFLSAVSVLLVVNYISYLVILLSSYGLFRRVFGNVTSAWVGAVTFVTSYASIRYGLTQVQDIAAFAFLSLTLYAGWRWYESRKNIWLFAGSVCVAFGMLVKESGAMGALFVGCLFLYAYRHRLLKAVQSVLLFSILPALVIFINSVRGADFTFSSADWFILNWERYAEENYTLVKWIGINATTFNVLWVFSLLGLYVLIKKWKHIDENIRLFIIAVLPVSASYFAWPLFMSRTVYIASWSFAALTILGVQFITKDFSKKYLLGVSIFAIIITPYILQLTIGYVPLFLILDQCNYSAVCSVETFLRIRSSFDGFMLHSETFIK